MSYETKGEVLSYDDPVGIHGWMEEFFERRALTIRPFNESAENLGLIWLASASWMG